MPALSFPTSLVRLTHCLPGMIALVSHAYLFASALIHNVTPYQITVCHRCMSHLVLITAIIPLTPAHHSPLHITAIIPLAPAHHGTCSPLPRLRTAITNLLQGPDVWISPLHVAGMSHTVCDTSCITRGSNYSVRSLNQETSFCFISTFYKGM